MRAIAAALLVLILASCGDDPEEGATPVEQTTTPEVDVYDCPSGMSDVPCDELPPTTRERTTTTPVPLDGTRSNPLPFGDTAALSIGESDPAWTFQVVEFIPDGTSAVMAENQFNDPPADGRQFAIVRLQATYRGLDEPAMLLSDVSFVAVDDSNLTYDLDDDCGVVPDELDQFGQVYAGGVVEGNLCWSVATEHIDSLLLGISPSFSSDAPYFMALR